MKKSDTFSSRLTIQSFSLFWFFFSFLSLVKIRSSLADFVPLTCSVAVNHSSWMCFSSHSLFVCIQSALFATALCPFAVYIRQRIIIINKNAYTLRGRKARKNHTIRNSFDSFCGNLVHTSGEIADLPRHK